MAAIKSIKTTSKTTVVHNNTDDIIDLDRTADDKLSINQHLRKRKSNDITNDNIQINKIKNNKKRNITIKHNERKQLVEQAKKLEQQANKDIQAEPTDNNNNDIIDNNDNDHDQGM